MATLTAVMASPSRGLRSRLRWRVLAWGIATVVMFAVNLRLSQTVAADSDGATDALQAWDMLHGNVLLHGWLTGDVSFYTTELPEYVLVEALHGLGVGDIHIAAAISYTLAMLLGALLAMGKAGTATGRVRLARAAIAAGIMLAPQFPAGVRILLGVPDHAGTAVAMLAAWLIADRLPARWYTIAATSVVLALGVVADITVLFVCALPLALVCGYRAVRDRGRDSASGGSASGGNARYEAILGGCALAAGIAGSQGLHLIHALGGFAAWPAATSLAAPGQIASRNLPLTGQGLLLLGGTSFTGVGRAQALIAAVHLAGIALCAAAIIVAAWRFTRDADRTVQVLLVALAFNVGAYAVGGRAFELLNTREMSGVLAIAAVLAGRVLGGPLLASRPATSARLSRLALSLRLTLCLALAGYLGGLGWELRQPVATGQVQQVIPWLRAHHLTDGLSGYWEASIVTLTSGGDVRIRPLVLERTGVYVNWEMRARQWYDPAANYANFVLFYPGQLPPGLMGTFTQVHGFTATDPVLARFGPPARTYQDGPYTIWVWNKNLLTDLPPAP